MSRIQINKIENISIPSNCKIPNYTNFDYAVDFDILQDDLNIRAGIVKGSRDKLRTIIALLSEYIYLEYMEKMKIKYMTCICKSNTFVESGDWWPYWDKASKSKSAQNYIFYHPYWKHLKGILKRNFNVNIALYSTISRFPYVSEYNIGMCSILNLTVGLKYYYFAKIIEPILVDDSIVFEQTDWVDY